MKDIVCENNNEFEFIKNFLNLKIVVNTSIKIFPILLFETSIKGKWLWLNDYIEDDEHFNNILYAKDIIRNEKLKRINNK